MLIINRFPASGTNTGRAPLTDQVFGHFAFSALTPLHFQQPYKEVLESTPQRRKLRPERVVSASTHTCKGEARLQAQVSFSPWQSPCSPRGPCLCLGTASDICWLQKCQEHLELVMRITREGGVDKVPTTVSTRSGLNNPSNPL